MTSNIVKLDMTLREEMGKEVTKKLRSDGNIPIEIYGKGFENIHAQIDEKQLKKAIYSSEAKMNAVFEVTVAGKSVYTMIHNFQRDAITDKLLHLDMLNVDLKKKTTTAISVKLSGIAPAIKKGGILVHNLHAIELEALPTEMPSFISVDVSGLADFHETIHVRDISFGEGVVVKTDLDALLCHIEGKRGLKDEETTAEGEDSAATTTAPAEGSDSTPAESAK